MIINTYEIEYEEIINNKIKFRIKVNKNQTIILVILNNENMIENIESYKYKINNKDYLLNNMESLRYFKINNKNNINLYITNNELIRNLEIEFIFTENYNMENINKDNFYITFEVIEYNISEIEYLEEYLENNEIIKYNYDLYLKIQDLNKIQRNIYEIEIENVNNIYDKIMINNDNLYHYMNKEESLISILEKNKNTDKIYNNNFLIKNNNKLLFNTKFINNLHITFLDKNSMKYIPLHNFNIRLKIK